VQQLTRSHKRPRLVALDDSVTVLASIRAAFERLGVEVITAEDPSELPREEFLSATVVVVDVQMVHVFGDDVVSLLRQGWQVDAPIFLYSSLSQDELDQRAAAAGAEGAVSKTRGIDSLVNRLGPLLLASTL
jgi:DNA-binding response OmpR family regulator